MEENTQMNRLMNEIREVTKKQKSASKVDEVRVMRTMINDPNYQISIYDKNKGYVGTRCPREEAVKFITSVTSSITGLDAKSTQEIANVYEFSKKDAIFLLDNARDFTTTYLDTGRKLPIVQSETSEASLLKKHINDREKQIPSNLGGGIAKVPSYDKIVCKSKCPKYNS